MEIDDDKIHDNQINNKNKNVFKYFQHSKKDKTNKTIRKKPSNFSEKNLDITKSKFQEKFDKMEENTNSNKTNLLINFKDNKIDESMTKNIKRKNKTMGIPASVSNFTFYK